MEKDLFDPKNPVWLEVVRVFGIFFNILSVLIGLYFAAREWINFGQFLLVIIGVIFMHLINMLSLNALYNLQSIRINSDKLISIQSELLKSLTGNTNYEQNKVVTKAPIFNESPVVSVKEDVTDISFQKDVSNKILIIEEGSTVIHEYAYIGNEEIEEVFIPNSVISIEKYAFHQCINLKKVYFQGTKSDWLNISVAEFNEALKTDILHFAVQ